MELFTDPTHSGAQGHREPVPQYQSTIPMGFSMGLGPPEGTDPCPGRPERGVSAVRGTQCEGGVWSGERREVTGGEGRAGVGGWVGRASLPGGKFWAAPSGPKGGPPVWHLVLLLNFKCKKQMHSALTPFNYWSRHTQFSTAEIRFVMGFGCSWSI